MQRHSLMLRRILLALIFCVSTFIGLPSHAAREECETARLERGEVVVDSRKMEGITYVIAKEIIDEPPGHVWPIMTNPFEFEGKISPRMKAVKVLVDKTDLSILKCTINIGVFFIPQICYTVESKYDPIQRISFKRLDGDL